MTDGGMGPSLREHPILDVLRSLAGELGCEVYLVGGAVRDQLLGRLTPSTELDVLAGQGCGPELAAAFAARVGAPPPVSFARFGTAMVEWGGLRVEFVSARRESYRANSRKPEVEPASIEEDLRRRDFTVNTLLMDLDGRIQDRLGVALPDLQARVIRTPLEPGVTFRDDPLRMLRGVRFCVQLDFSLDPGLPAVMRELAPRLAPPVVSPERIAEELVKMLTGSAPDRALHLLAETGLLEVVLPEVAATRGVEQGGHHLWDVFGHTAEALRRSPPGLEVRLAVLLHDVAKPVTRTPEGAFTGHEKVGAEMAREILGRLRFSNHTVERVSRLVGLHLRPVYYERSWTDGAVRRLMAAAGDLFPELMAVARADLGASAYPHPEKIDELEARAAELAREPARFQPPVSGEDVMRVLGLKPGPRVGEVKRQVTELVLEGTIPPTREAVMAYLRSLRPE